MHPTARLLSRPGFWQRSLVEAQTFARKVYNLEGLHRPDKPYPLISFDKPEAIEECKVASDKELGGFSTANLDFHPATATEPAHARFHGNISVELPQNRRDVPRTGFAMWRTWEPRMTLFGAPLWDIDRYLYLAIRFKSDGRKYYINLQTKSIVPTDIHQHRLYSKNTGEWETLVINWNDFVRTNGGVIVEPQRELLRQRVKTVGIGSVDRLPGPFDLKIAKIWATNWLDPDEIRESGGDPETEIAHQSHEVGRPSTKIFGEKLRLF